MNLAGAVASILLKHIGGFDWVRYSDALFLALYREEAPVEGTDTIAFFLDEGGVYAHPVTVAAAIAEFAEKLGVPVSCISVYGDSVIVQEKCLERLVAEATKHLEKKYGKGYVDELQRIVEMAQIDAEIAKKVYERIHVEGKAEWLRGMPVEDVLRLNDIIAKI